MTIEQKQPCDCNTANEPSCCESPSLTMLPLQSDLPADAPDEPCCGPPAGPPSSPHERPGYRLCSFVETFINTPVGPVPRVKTNLGFRDRLGTLSVRLDVGRNDYKVSPGLYAVGSPDSQSPVLVSANYKLSFDHLRTHLEGLDAWVLVLDTRGINVWCAAGKGTFGTAEIIQRVQQTGIAKVVKHHRLILPQLGAVGVSAIKVKRGCGFEVVWGPILARDIQAFLKDGMKAKVSMRRVTFTTAERLVLVPVEVILLRKYLLWTLAAIFLLSGIGSNIFSFSAAWHRGLLAAAATLAGIFAGCALVPALLPWIPGRAFSFKGGLAGLVFGVVAVNLMTPNPYISFWPGVSLVLLATALGSFLAMNFTGSTPFTSPSGVEKEMRLAIPVQVTTALLGVIVWVWSAF